MPINRIPEFASTADLMVALGERVAGLRLRKNLKQEDLAKEAGVSSRAVRDLEKGRGSSLETLLKVLRVLGDLREALETLVPAPSISPLQMLHAPKGRRRASRAKP